MTWAPLPAHLAKAAAGNRHARRGARKELYATLTAVVEARPCGSCSACCTSLGVQSLRKPAGTPCSHLAAAGGCGIHARRPTACKEFFCLWRMGVLDDGDRPDLAGVVLNPKTTGGVRWVQAMESTPGSLERDETFAKLNRVAAELNVALVICRPSDQEPIDILGSAPNVEALATALRRSLPVTK